MVRVMEHWNSLSREVMGSAMEIFKSCLDAYLCDLLQEPALAGGVGLNDLLRTLPTPVILLHYTNRGIEEKKCLIKGFKPLGLCLFFFLKLMK